MKNIIDHARLTAVAAVCVYTSFPVQRMMHGCAYVSIGSQVGNDEKSALLSLELTATPKTFDESENYIERVPS